MLSSAGDCGEQIGRAARGLQRVVRCHGAVRPRPWRRPHVRIRVTKPAVPRDRRWAATTCSWCGGSMDPKPEDGFRRGARNPPGTSPGTSPSRDLQSICSPGDPAAGGGPRVAAADPAGVGRPAARARPPGSTTAASTAKATTVSPGRSTPCWRSAACRPTGAPEQALTPSPSTGVTSALSFGVTPPGRLSAPVTPCHSGVVPRVGACWELAGSGCRRTGEGQEIAAAVSPIGRNRRLLR